MGTTCELDRGGRWAGGAGHSARAAHTGQILRQVSRLRRRQRGSQPYRATQAARALGARHHGARLGAAVPPVWRTRGSRTVRGSGKRGASLGGVRRRRAVRTDLDGDLLAKGGRVTEGGATRS